MSAGSAMENLPPYKLAVVGTHRDQEHKCMETRQQKCQKLREILRCQDDYMISYKETDFIFPLDTKHLGEDDVQAISGTSAANEVYESVHSKSKRMLLCCSAVSFHEKLP